MKYAYIEITEKCNLNCPFCPSASLGNARGEMPFELFEKVLQNLKGHVQEIYLHVLGEPLLHPQFPQILECANRYGFPVNLTTNGVLISKRSADILESKAIRQINFSTHSYAYLEKERAMDALSGALEFTDALISKRPEVYVNFRLWNEASDARSEAWNEVVVQTLSSHFHTDLSHAEFSVRHKSNPIVGRIYLHRDSRFSWPDGSGEASERGTCHGVIDQCAILFDGRVAPCCLDYKANVLLGKFPEDSFDSIFQGEKAKCIREGFLNRKLVDPFCQKCPFIKRFCK